MSEESNALARAKRQRHKERAEAARLANRGAPPLLTGSSAISSRSPKGDIARRAGLALDELLRSRDELVGERKIEGPLVAHLIAAIESVGQAKMKLRGL